MYQYHSSPTDDSSKCAGHFCRGNKAPTAKQLYHTSCLSSWADFLIGLVALPFAFLVGLKQLLGVGPFCPLAKAFIVITTMGITASCSHLAVISMDRYIAIKYPLRYRDIVTETRIIISVVLAWVFTLLVTINELVLALIDNESLLFTVGE